MRANDIRAGLLGRVLLRDMARHSMLRARRATIFCVTITQRKIMDLLMCNAKRCNLITFLTPAPIRNHALIMAFMRILRQAAHLVRGLMAMAMIRRSNNHRIIMARIRTRSSNRFQVAITGMGRVVLISVTIIISILMRNVATLRLMDYKVVMMVRKFKVTLMILRRVTINVSYRQAALTLNRNLIMIIRTMAMRTLMARTMSKASKIIRLRTQQRVHFIKRIHRIIVLNRRRKIRLSSNVTITKRIRVRQDVRLTRLSGAIRVRNRLPSIIVRHARVLRYRFHGAKDEQGTRFERRRINHALIMPIRDNDRLAIPWLRISASINKDRLFPARINRASVIQVSYHNSRVAMDVGDRAIRMGMILV